MSSWLYSILASPVWFIQNKWISANSISLAELESECVCNTPDTFASTPDIQIVSIEGNIGAGKSDIYHTLKETIQSTDNPFKDRIVFLPEPVTEWESLVDLEGKNILEHFYSDPQRYSFTFQIMAYISRLSQFRAAIRQIRKSQTQMQPNSSHGSKPWIIISERCMLTDRYVFANMLFQSGHLTALEMNIYLKWFDEFASDKELQLSRLIYVKTSPEICMDRIHARNRGGETGITLDYLTKCDEMHDRYMQRFLGDDTIHINMLNGNKPKDCIPDHVNTICELLELDGIQRSKWATSLLAFTCYQK